MFQTKPAKDGKPFQKRDVALVQDELPEQTAEQLPEDDDLIGETGSELLDTDIEIEPEPEEIQPEESAQDDQPAQETENGSEA